MEIDDPTDFAKTAPWNFISYIYGGKYTIWQHQEGHLYIQEKGKPRPTKDSGGWYSVTEYFAERKGLGLQGTEQEVKDYGNIPDSVQAAISRSDGVVSWPQFRTTEDEEVVDKWLVEIRHPLAYKPSSRKWRFHQIIQELSSKEARKGR